MSEHPPPNSAADIDPASGTRTSPPLLSVGIPVYNGAKWIDEAIESILVQSVTDLELIISDNASTDDTEAVCRAAAARDSRVRYHRNSTNIGIYRNFDRVFELSTGRYFKWAADGDFCLEGFFEKCLAVLEARPDVVLAYPMTIQLFTAPGGVEVAQEYDDNLHVEDERPSTRFASYLAHEKINNAMHGIIRADALRRTSLNRPMPGSDISMIAELALLGKIVQVPEFLFVRRFDEETSSLMMDDATALERGVPQKRTATQRVMLHVHRFLSVARAPIGFSEKLRAWLHLSLGLSSVPVRAVRKLVRMLIPGL